MDDSTCFQKDRLTAAQPTPSQIVMSQEEWREFLRKQPLVYQRIFILLREGSTPDEIAEELKIHLVAGMTEADGELRYNTSVLIGPEGKLIGKYRKHALEHELVRNTPGTNTPAFNTDLGRLGLMICADRKHSDLVSQIVAGGAEFLLCPSGGMFGPKSNDHILQARSKENGRYIVFVHPCEFLVTGPDGAVLTTTLLGSNLEISASEAGSEKDTKQVFYFDLPLKMK